MINRGRAVAIAWQPGPRASGDSMALPEVSAMTDGTIIAPNGAAIGVMKIRLDYYPDDPLCVKLVLGADMPDPHPWEASRDVLKTAFLDLKPAGFGDLTCVPVDLSIERANLCPGWVRVTLSGQDDDRQPCTLELMVPPIVVRRFLKRTFELVPAGDECKRLVIPDTIASMFGDTERGSA